MYGKLYTQGKSDIQSFPQFWRVLSHAGFLLTGYLFVDSDFLLRNDCCKMGRCYEMVGCVDPDDISARIFKVTIFYFAL